MKLSILGIDFHTAGLDLRAKVASCTRLEKVAPHWQERVLLLTCNRAEIIGVGDENVESVLDRWIAELQLNTSDKAAFRYHQDEEALSHLFRVVSGMESMVVGETQISGQVKKAYEEAAQKGEVQKVLHRCFQQAFKVAKRVRGTTDVGRLAVSVPSISVKLAEKVLGNLSQRSVCILGLGEIGRVAAEHFGSVQPRKLILYNRTLSVAEELAAKLAQENISCEVSSEVETAVAKADVVVSAVGATILTKSQLEVLDKRGLPILVIDLSVPPSIEKCGVHHLFLYSIDDLKKIADENAQLRGHEVERADAIIQEESRRVWTNLQTLSVSQTFDRLAQKVDTLTKEELQGLRAQMSSVSEKDWLEIERMARRLSSKILQDPMMELKNQIQQNKEPESMIQLFRSIFRI